MDNADSGVASQQKISTESHFRLVIEHVCMKDITSYQFQQWHIKHKFVYNIHKNNTQKFLLKMSFYKLKSSDGKIFTVDAATVKQMVTVQTMIDHEDEDSDELIPVSTVEAQVLEKIIQWTAYHKIDHGKREKIAWYIQYFNVELKKKFEICIAADYLEIKSLLNETCRNVLINYN